MNEKENGECIEMKKVFPLLLQIFHHQQCYRPANNVTRGVFVVGDDIGSMMVKSISDTTPNIVLSLAFHASSMVFDAIIVYYCKFVRRTMDNSCVTLLTSITHGIFHLDYSYCTRVVPTIKDWPSRAA